MDFEWIFKSILLGVVIGTPNMLFLSFPYPGLAKCALNCPLSRVSSFCRDAFVVDAFLSETFIYCRSFSLKDRLTAL